MKYDIPPLAKTVVREVVAPQARAAYAFGTRTRAERLRDAWALAGVHDAFTAYWRSWGRRLNP